MKVNGYKIEPFANLVSANLNFANLEGANLYRATLEGASLNFANLKGANLNFARLVRADMDGANLECAKLVRANLNFANLKGANLYRATLEGASLEKANLEDARLPEFQIPQACELIVWKKVRSGGSRGGLAKLRIPPEAKRTASLIGNKCRAEYAEVLEAPDDAESIYRTGFQTSLAYETGRAVYPDKYCDDIRIECSSGIHFFMTKKEAAAY